MSAHDYVDIYLNRLLVDSVPGLSPGLARDPVLLECFRLAQSSRLRPTPSCVGGFRSGDGPPADRCIRTVRALPRSPKTPRKKL